MPDAAPDNPTPLLVGRREAARLIGVGARTFDRLSAAGLIGPKPLRLGGRVMYRARELQRWVESSAAAGGLADRVAWLAMENSRVSS